MKKENDTVYVKTFNKLGKLALASILILMFSYFYGWTYVVPFIFGLIAMIITTSSSLAFGFVFFRDNEDIDNGVIYSKKQKIPLKIDPSLDKDIEINVTKPVVEKSIRELMEENIISHDNDQTDDIHFEAIQNQIKNDLELKKEYILKREMLQHELEGIKRKNESLENIKKEVMPYLFQAPKDNRFGDK